MNRKQNRLLDRNFDGMATRFKRNVYGGLKGKVRLAVLNRDIAPYLQAAPLRILDAGGGQGQFSLPLCAQGHHVTLCDISQDMLAIAQETIEEEQLTTATLKHCALQDTQEFPEDSFDLVCCHAVLEWMSEPSTALDFLLPPLKTGGILSLAFYNKNAIIMKNALRINYEKIINEDFYGYRGSLTPINPLDKETVLQWCKEKGLEILSVSGVRVFYDYLLDPTTRDTSPEGLLAAELKYSTVEPFLSLGRYIHVVVRKK